VTDRAHGDDGPVGSYQAPMQDVKIQQWYTNGKPRRLPPIERTHA